MKKHIEIKPGQLWLDENGIYCHGYKGGVVYVILSKEPDEDWRFAQFQDWWMGAQVREGITEKELNKLKYVGHISDFKKEEKCNHQDNA